MSTAKQPRATRSPLNQNAVLHRIHSQSRTASFRKYLEELLLKLCRLDTTPNPVVEKMRAAEDACFQIIETELESFSRSASLERRPVNPAIKAHPHFSLLHFTKTAEKPAGLTPEEAYRGRSNLVYRLRGSGEGRGLSVALNGHIDVVAPFFPPRLRGKSVCGRGACDDKGPVVAIVAALKLLNYLVAETSLELKRDVLAMFVIEEETGGNGSLSLALDRELKTLYESLVVCECTGLRVHPANRGAVWYRAQLEAPQDASTLELAAFVIEELEKEGAAIRAESAHPLFPQRPVQTCHGMIGPFGEHPSRICGRVVFSIRTGKKLRPAFEQLVRDCLESGLAGYVGIYGDKSKVLDASTGKPMVARHYDLRRTRFGFDVEVHGATGHMGAIRERDGAITKMAHLVQSLCRCRRRLEQLAGSPVRLELTAPQGSKAARKDSSASLVLEGGQGFVPTHSIEEVMERLRQAAARGAKNYLNRIGCESNADEAVTVTYEKLHNVAFDGDPDSLSVRNAIAAAKACDLWTNEPVLGWTVSCDARLFASEHPDLQVLTFGPGQLGFAHSDNEQIAIDEIRMAAEFLALFLLRQTGTLPD